MGEAQFFLQVVVAGQLVEASDHQVNIVKRVAATRLLDLFTRECSEGQTELLEHLVLPLLDQAAWGDDQDALGIGPHQQLADEQARHNGFAGARIVS